MKNTSHVSNAVIESALESYLLKEGFDIIDRRCGHSFDYVCRGEDAEIVFVACSAGDGTDNSEESIDRMELEKDMFRYLAQSEIAAPAIKLRYDDIHVFVCADGRGMLRHHRAAAE